MGDAIVDYVQIVEDENGQFRVRARSNNGEIVWTSEQYDNKEWALAVALDSGKPLKQDEDDPPRRGGILGITGGMI